MQQRPRRNSATDNAPLQAMGVLAKRKTKPTLARPPQRAQALPRRLALQPLGATTEPPSGDSARHTSDRDVGRASARQTRGRPHLCLHADCLRHCATAVAHAARGTVAWGQASREGAT